MKSERPCLLGRGGVSEVEDGVEQVGESQAAADKLLFDDGSPVGDVVVRDVCAGEEVGVDVGCDCDCFFGPVVDCAADDFGLLSGFEAVDLLLPLGIAPFVSGFGERRVPSGVEVGLAIEEFHFDAVAAEVGGVAHVEGHVHVADDVDENFEREVAFLRSRIGVVEDFDARFDGCDGVAGRVSGRFFVADVLIDVFVVPGFGVGERTLMACVVEPVGPVDYRFAVEHRVDCGLGRGCEVLLGDVGCHVVAFLTPGQSVERDEREQDYGQK